MRILYSLAMYLGLPLILGHLALRGLRDRDYLKRWPERFGVFEPTSKPGGLVVHAASVGEVNAAAPLVRGLLERFPQHGLTLTTFTPTGSARAVALFGDRVSHVHAPLDLPGAVRRFFDRTRPAGLVIMETEIWPNLIAAAARRGLPVMIANARMSERSVRGYRRWRRLVAGTLRKVSFTAAQGQADADRFVSCGADASRIEVYGNLKYDLQLPDGVAAQAIELRAGWGSERPVLLGGSTHADDEEALLTSFKALLGKHPDALLILVHRHPERFDEAARTASEAGLRVERYSETGACSSAAQCFVVDAMGELMRYYAACDVALVGGTFARIGGHNPLEPAALGKPVLVGPHTFHFEEITSSLCEAGAALQVHAPGEFQRQVLELFREPVTMERMGQAGKALVAQGRGALEKTLSRMEVLLRR